MTVLDSTPRDQYTASGGQTVFTYTFEIAAAGDIKVLQNGTLINQGAGAGEYAVSGVGVDTGGNVTLVTGATAGDILTIYRDMALERLTAYTNAGDFLAADVNNDFDRLWLALQQNGGDLDGRVLIAPNTDPTGIDMTIPDKATRLDKYLKFNVTTGNPEVADPTALFAYAGLNHYNFTGDGTTVNFTLGMEPGVENNTQVYIDGVYQQKNTYNVSGAIVQFSAAPPSLSTIEVMVIEVLPIGSTTASQVSFTQAGSTYGRNVQLKLQESVSVTDFGAVGDGVTDDTVELTAAVAAVIADGTNVLEVPAGTSCLTTASIPNLHDIRLVGGGVITRGGNTFTITRSRSTVQFFYVDPAGADTNDGITSNQPFATIQHAVDVVNGYGKVVGRQKIQCAGGTYAEQVTLYDGMAQEDNYLEFNFPTDPGIQGDPSAWPAGGAILDGSGLGSIGFSVGRYNKVYISYLLFKDWFDAGQPVTSNTYYGCGVDEYSFLYAYGCSGIDNGLSTFSVTPMGSAVITGGIIEGGKRAIQNIGGSLSLSANNSTTFTTIKGSEEYGIYQKHQSRTVLDYTRFMDCGNNAAAVNYGAALFAYKAGASIDTRGCVFTNNNYVYNLRGGHLGRHPALVDVMGSGGTANNYLYKVNGNGDDDLLSYQTVIGRSLQKSGAEITTSQTAYASLLIDSAVIPAGYFVRNHQYLDIYIAGTNDGGGTATVRPLLLLAGPVNASIGTYDVAANAYFEIRIRVTPVTGGLSQICTFNCTNATKSGQEIKDFTTAHDFATKTIEFKLDGKVSVGTNTLTYHAYSATLWG